MFADNLILVWVVAAIFYIPIHVGVPSLVVFLVLDVSDDQRKMLLKRVVIESVISVLITFPLAAWLWQSYLWVSVILLVAGMLVPFWTLKSYFK